MDGNNYPGANINTFQTSEQCDPSDTANNTNKKLCDILLTQAGKQTHESYSGTGTLSCGAAESSSECRITGDMAEACGYCGDGAFQSNETCEYVGGSIIFEGGINGSTICNNSNHSEPENPSTYSSSDLGYGTDTSETYIYSGQIEEWTVPETGIYEIEAFGARGGNGNQYYCAEIGCWGFCCDRYDWVSNEGCKGASVTAQFKLEKDQKLRFLVGKHGGERKDTENPMSGGGGGGSFVVLCNNSTCSAPTPLVIAGGGGGATPWSSIGSSCSGGQASTSGASTNKTSGGTNGGDGGNFSTDACSSGGLGWTNHNSAFTGSTPSTTPTAMYGVKAMEGTNCSKYSSGSTHGGFGGGGSTFFYNSNFIDAGGGGGYSGGGSGYDNGDSDVQGGAGGGSYYNTTYSGYVAYDNDAASNHWTTGGATTDDGRITITMKKYPGCNAANCSKKTDSVNDFVACGSTVVTRNCTDLPANAEWWRETCTDSSSNNACEQSGAYSENSPSPSSTGYCYYHCKSGYTYENGQCINYKYAQCPTTGGELPAETDKWEWNTVSEVKLEWNGSWPDAPTETNHCGPSTTECCYKCKDGTAYEKVGDVHHCWGSRTTEECGAKPANSSWNDGGKNGKFTQSYSGGSWLPASVAAVYDTNKGDCHYVCDTNYHYESADGGKCVYKERRTASCEGYPIANSHWNDSNGGDGKFTQTWNPSFEGCSTDPVSDPEKCWDPQTKTTVHNSTQGDCSYECNTETYHYEDGECKENSKTTAACTPAELYENADWNDNGKNGLFTQTWDFNTSTWIPASKDAESSSTPGDCRFMCHTNFTWNSTAKTCDANSQAGTCNGDKPANSSWNDNGKGGKFTQTWTYVDGEWKWWPESIDTKWNQSAAGECRYKCDNDYHYESADGGKCVYKERRKLSCTGSPIEHSSWNDGQSGSNVGTFKQTWNPSFEGCSTDPVSDPEKCWDPQSKTTVRSDTEGDCFYECDANYHYEEDPDGSNKLCRYNSRTTVNCTPYPLYDNADWNDSGKNGIFTQTWNPSALPGVCTDPVHDPEKCWDPQSKNAESSSTPGDCRFVCHTNFTWNSSICDPNTQAGTCGGSMPANSSWNDDGKYYTGTNGGHGTFTQTWTNVGGTWKWWPESIDWDWSQGTTGECRFKCNDNFTWNSTGRTCDANSQAGTCTLPTGLAHYVWNDEGHHYTGTGGVSGTFTQNWIEVSANNGYWDPESMNAVYDTTAGTCHYTCEQGATYAESYHYQRLNGVDACVLNTRNIGCLADTMPTGAVSNMSSSEITQTWNPSAFSDCDPVSDPEKCWYPRNEYNYDAAENYDATEGGSTANKCAYKCDTNFTWNDTSKQCGGSKVTVECTNLPNNAEWWNPNDPAKPTEQKITQTWTEISGSWQWEPPSFTGENTAAGVENRCYFHCHDNYTYGSGNTCIAHTQSGTCGGKPANSSWNDDGYNYNNVKGTFKQTWNEDHAGCDGTNCWYPVSIAAVYDTNKGECHYTCDTDYHYQKFNGADACVLNTRRELYCTGGEHNTPITNSSWNDGQSGSNAGTFEQTWNTGLPNCNPVTAPEKCWDPQTSDALLTFDADKTNDHADCHYMCDFNYHKNGSACTWNEQRVTECDGKPANSSWVAGKEDGLFDQTWNYDLPGWDPESKPASHSSDPSDAGDCKFECNTNFTWTDDSYCKADKQRAECNGDNPDHSSWNDTNYNHEGEGGTFTQTWIEVSANNGYWDPASIDTDWSQETPGKCKFKCNTNYNWNSGTKTCDALKQTVTSCTLPAGLANYSWNDGGKNGKFEQTWIEVSANNGSWDPASMNAVYNTNEGECHYTCNSGYHYQRLNGVDACVLDTRTELYCTDNHNTPAQNSGWHDGGKSGKFTQTWNPNLSGCDPVTAPEKCWDPQTPALTFDDDSVTTTGDCHYNCNTSYHYEDTNGSKKCVYNSRTTAACGSKPSENSNWNDGGKNGTFTQNWNTGLSTCTDPAHHPENCWDPASKDAEYNTEKGDCHYNCNTGYHYQKLNGADVCFSDTRRTASCDGSPIANSHWNGQTDGKFTQTWNTSLTGCNRVTAPENCWDPQTKTTAYGSGDCSYTCNTNFTWTTENNVSYCKPDTRRELYCTDGDHKTPIGHSSWNDGQSGSNIGKFEQTWTNDNGTWKWLPESVDPEYSDTTGDCHYKCNYNYSPNSTASQCNPAKREGNSMQSCQYNGTSNAPAHGFWWQTKIPQTWNEDLNGGCTSNCWDPTLTATNSDYTDDYTGSNAGKCKFGCGELNENGTYKKKYDWDSTNNRCQYCGDQKKNGPEGCDTNEYTNNDILSCITKVERKTTSSSYECKDANAGCDNNNYNYTYYTCSRSCLGCVETWTCTKNTTGQCGKPDETCPAAVSDQVEFKGL
ncbi:MAG: hypothetical protein J5621_00755 [Paludibacteraceae bacterium]|nr:hypothetical protein [Paludibacteraceae bacterium]